MAPFHGQQRRELDVPLPKDFVTDADASRVKQLLDVQLAQGEAVIQLESVTENTEGKTVAVGLPINPSSTDYRP